MTKIPRPENPTFPEIIEYMEAMHACAERSAGQSRNFSLATLGALGALLVTLGGALWNGAHWFAATDTKLDTVATLVVDSRTNASKIDQLSTQVQVLQATSQENNTALLGPNSAANQRLRRAGK